MKMLATQLAGLFQEIAKRSEAIEDTAQLLAQAAVGNGTIYLAAFGEMNAVLSAALGSEEPLRCAAEWRPDSIVTHADRVWILAVNHEGDELAGRLNDAHLPFAMLAARTREPVEADAFISLHIDNGLVLQDNGSRTVIPDAMGALFAYYAVKAAIDEMLED